MPNVCCTRTHLICWSLAVGSATLSAACAAEVEDEAPLGVRAAELDCANCAGDGPSDDGPVDDVPSPDEPDQPSDAPTADAEGLSDETGTVSQELAVPRCCMEWARNGINTGLQGCDDTTLPSPLAELYCSTATVTKGGDTGQLVNGTCRSTGRCPQVREPTCEHFEGPCTGTHLWVWDTAPTRCVSGKRSTACTSGWNLYPWLVECSDGSDSQGVGVCLW